MLTILAIIAALFVGAALGMLFLSIFVVSGRSDERARWNFTCRQLKPGGRYVLTTEKELTRDQAERIREQLKAAFPETFFGVVSGMSFDELPPVDPELSGMGPRA